MAGARKAPRLVARDARSGRVLGWDMSIATPLDRTEPGRRFASDTECLPVLRRLIASGEVTLHIDRSRLGALGSPVAIQAEGTHWVLLFLGGAGVVWWWAGAAAGAAAAAVVVVAYWLIGRPRNERNLRRRVLDKALTDIAVWRKLWRFGGVTLARASSRCVAPDDSWIGFVEDAGPAP